MKIVTVELDDVTAYVLATNQGWNPTVEDTSQEMVDDAYPLIDNPVSIEDFLSLACKAYISKHVLDGIRGDLSNTLKGVNSKIEQAIANKTFDEDLAKGDLGSFLAYVADQVKLFQS